MYNEIVENVSNVGVNKEKYASSNPLKFLVASILAGFFVGIGILLIFSISGQLQGSPYTKLIMGATFGIALSLVIMAGSELFTGNNYVLGMSLFNKKLTLSKVIKVWLICWIGNLIGSFLVSLFFIKAGYASMEDPMGAAIQNASNLKMNAPAFSLFFRAVLCNILVCLAVHCGLKMKSESGKLIMIWWCLLAFITSGFEHSIANMTIFCTSLLTTHIDGVSISGMFFNLGITTLGNMVGGLLLAVAYFSLKTKEQ